MLGYTVFIAPGGSLVKRMVKKYKPKAVIGVGCPPEINEGSALMEAYGIPVLSVPLTKDGCVNTCVDIDELLEALHLGIKDVKNVKDNVEK